MIKNIIFDIGNVILEGNSSFALNYLDLDEEDKKLIKDVLFNSNRYLDLDYGLLDYKGYFDKYSFLLPDRLKEKAYYALSNSFRIRKINSNIIDLIIKLKSKYNLYILSNNNKEVIDYLKNTILNDYIDGWIISCDVKTIKPFDKIYLALFNTYNIKPSECYFIDDKKENINTAIKLGMKGFILDWNNNSYEDLIEDMKNNNIDI